LHRAVAPFPADTGASVRLGAELVLVVIDGDDAAVVLP